MNHSIPSDMTGTIPYRSIDGQREAAEERRKHFPYRFSRDGRQLGGKFTVAENARRLLRFFYWERRLAQALGAWTLSIPEFEVKVETGRHIFYHADGARLLRERLGEQEMRLKEIDAFRDSEIDRFIEEMLSASSAQPAVNRTNELVQSFLLMGNQRFQISPATIAAKPKASIPTNFFFASIFFANH